MSRYVVTKSFKSFKEGELVELIAVSPMYKVRKVGDISARACLTPYEMKNYLCKTY